MKTLSTLFALTALITTTSAHALFEPNWERPVFSAEMNVIDSQSTFENAGNVTLTITHRSNIQNPSQSGPTGILLTWTDAQSSNTQDSLLSVTSITDIGCGSVEYTAKIENSDLDPSERERFTVTLQDHSRRFCKDYKEYKWEASVRRGWGFCGTSDSTMQLGGNPQTIYTMQAF
jgi:hypothetical protein